MWEFESAGKINRFTEKKAENVYEHFLNTEWKDMSFSDLIKNDDFLNWISSLILKIAKGVDSSENRIKAKSNLLRNFKLMWLDPEVIPEGIRKNCYTETERGFKLERKSITLDRIKILEGTEWITQGYHPKGMDPFENLLG